MEKTKTTNEGGASQNRAVGQINQVGLLSYQFIAQAIVAETVRTNNLGRIVDLLRQREELLKMLRAVAEHTLSIDDDATRMIGGWRAQLRDDVWATIDWVQAAGVPVAHAQGGEIDAAIKGQII